MTTEDERGRKAGVEWYGQQCADAGHCLRADGICCPAESCDLEDGIITVDNAKRPPEETR